MTIGISKEDAFYLINQPSAKDGFISKSDLLNYLKELNPWLPIDENTPRDKPVLIYDGKFKRIGCWVEDNQAFLDEWGYAINAKFYQELPEYPI